MKISKRMISIMSIAFSFSLVGLYMYTDESTVTIGALIGHLWLLSVSAVE
jgi:hypothetical protein